jgi:sarcosine oxidase
VSDYDVIVVGLGAYGASALYQLSKRGAQVLGIDRFAPPHDRGSSHGETRITRLSNGESPHYTRLVRRSHEIWRELERETGAELLNQCGGLVISGAGAGSVHVADFFAKTVRNAEANGVAHERLDAAQIRARFPQFAAAEPEMGYYEPEAGYVRPETCIGVQLGLAEKKYGAQIRRNTEVLGFAERPDRVAVETAAETFRAQQLIVAAGGWMPQLPGGEFRDLLKVYRQQLYWFADDAEAHRPGRFPVFIWETGAKKEGIYGFPDIGGGVKIATEQYDDEAAPAEPTAAQRQEIDALVRRHLPGVSWRCLRTAACSYTVTPDREFIIDHASPRVIVVSACSGHGFKHSAALGEGLADMAQGRAPWIDMTPFRLSRFAAAR